MKLLLTLIILQGILFSSEGAGATGVTAQPITLPITRPVRPVVRPIVNTGLVHQDNYYNTTYETNCDKYIEILAQKDKEILELKQQIESLKNKDQVNLQKSLKAEFDKEMKKFENR